MFKSFFKKKVNNELKKTPTIEDDNLFTIVCVLVEAALVDNNFGNLVVGSSPLRKVIVS